jgi:hypothetical protein
MKKDLIDTIMEKEFHALTDSERSELASVCSSEEEFNQLKDVFIGVEQMAAVTPIPKAETKQRLDDLFDATYPKAAPVWYSSVLAVVIKQGKPVHRQPLLQVAAIALIVLMVVPFWSSNAELLDAPNQFAEAKESVDVPYSGTRETGKPLAEAKNFTPVEIEAPEVQPISEPMLVASANAVVSSQTLTDATSPGSNHPDGVFVAVSQPASENPEMFDLLTATF